MSKARERQRERVSGRARAIKHKDSFSSKCFRRPDGARLFQVKKEGVIIIDIIPYMVPEGAKNPYANGRMHFERTYFTHRDIGVENDVYPCLKKTFLKPCPICDYRAKLVRDGAKDEDLVKALAPKERQLWNVYDRENPEFGVQIWDISFFLFGKLLDHYIVNSDEDEGYEFFADPEEGFTLKVGFSEEHLGGNSFFAAKSIMFKKRREPLPQELLDQAYILDELLIEYDYDELKSIFMEATDLNGEKKDESDDDDLYYDEPKSRQLAKSSKPVRLAERTKAVQDDELTEEPLADEEDEEEDFEEITVEDEDEDNNNEDEELDFDEDEMPKKKQVSAKQLPKYEKLPEEFVEEDDEYVEQAKAELKKRDALKNAKIAAKSSKKEKQRSAQNASLSSKVTTNSKDIEDEDWDQW